MVCIYCQSTHIHKDGNHNGYQRYKCLNCRKRFDGEKYTAECEWFFHFNTKLKRTNNNLLTRANYCVPNIELDCKEKQLILWAKHYIEQNGRPPLLCPPSYYTIPNEIFSDEEHYTESYVKKHYSDCMLNFDLNMEYFSKLNYDKFNQYISQFTKKKRFIEITNLAEVSNKTGAYILVLDKYKQAYIGITNSTKGIKNRILQHWSAQKEFSRLIYGDVKTSILSIDSFGALDTTRIFYKELKWYQDLDEYERKLVSEFKPEYRLNRVAGGLNAEDDATLRNLQLLSTLQKRELEL